MKTLLIFLVGLILIPQNSISQLKPLRPLNGLKPLNPRKDNSSSNLKPKWLIELEKERQRNLKIAELKKGNRLLKNKPYNGPIPQDFIWLFLEGLAAGVETRNRQNPYTVKNANGSSAYGLWQITNSFWNYYSQKYFNKILPKTPANQRKIAYVAASEMYKRYKSNRTLEMTARLMAKEWYGGQARMNWSWNSIPNPRQNNLTFRQYTNKVIREMKRRLKGKSFKYYLNKNKTKK